MAHGSSEAKTPPFAKRPDLNRLGSRSQTSAFDDRDLDDAHGELNQENMHTWQETGRGAGPGERAQAVAAGVGGT